MSETTTATDGAGSNPPPGGGGDSDVETRARQMGWKPREEFRGRGDQWLPPEQFLERGFESPAVMAERLKVMTDRMAGFERSNRDLTTKFDQAIDTINTMTTMARSSERRAYERARADLEREREKAVEAGDTQTFRRLDTEIRDLDKAAPAAPVTPSTTAPVVTPQGQPQPNGPDPAVLDFYRRNPWYGKDAAMTAEADLIHTGLLNTRRDLTMEQNLAEVQRRINAQFRTERAPPTETTGTDDNPRRSEPGAVSPASTGTNNTRRTDRRSFNNMPEESKQAYRRYKSMLAGKGEPLTEAEWAADYWAQFEDEV